MPTYPVKHLETGEQKELSMSMMAYGEWRKENPDWDKDWVTERSRKPWEELKSQPSLRTMEFVEVACQNYFEIRP